MLPYTYFNKVHCCRFLILAQKRSAFEIASYTCASISGSIACFAAFSLIQRRSISGLISRFLTDIRASFTVFAENSPCSALKISAFRSLVVKVDKSFSISSSLSVAIACKSLIADRKSPPEYSAIFSKRASSTVIPSFLQIFFNTFFIVAARRR